MSTILLAAGLIAQTDTTAMTEAFREGFMSVPTERAMTNLGWLFLGSVAIVVVVALLSRRSRPPRETPPADYLTLMVDVLQLSEEQRQDLRSLTVRCGLSQPAAMLLSPACLARAAGKSNHPALEARLNQLCRQLFGEDLPRKIQSP